MTAFLVPMNLTTSGLVRSGKGMLAMININNISSDNSFTVYDGISTDGTQIANINCSNGLNVPTSMHFNAQMTNGIYIAFDNDTLGSDITVVYEKED